VNLPIQQSDLAEGEMPPERFAWRVAAPRDLCINALINGGIGWWLFGERSEVSLTGPGGLASMALPMTFFLAVLTTFFGWWNGIARRRAMGKGVVWATGIPWARRAWLDAALVGGLAWVVAVVTAAVLRRLLPSAAAGPAGGVFGIACYAGILAYFLHGRAVVRALHNRPASEPLIE
jgi:hypothetical protein